MKKWFGLILLVLFGTLSSIWLVQDSSNLPKEDVAKQTSETKAETNQEAENVSTKYLIIDEGIVRGLKTELTLPERLNLSIPLFYGSIRITQIGENAFVGRNEIEAVRIGEGVSEIGRNAFSGCQNLKSVVIPSSVTKIGSSVFSNCPKLVNNTIISRSPVIFDWWVNFHVDKNQTLSSLDTINLTEYKNSADQSFNIVGEEAFTRCDKLKEITLGKEVNEIHDHAFKHCSNLVKVNLPSSLTYIGVGVFDGCDQLTCRGVINHSSILFDWWFKNHLYYGRSLHELPAVNLAGYKNSDQKHFRIIAKGALNFNEENSILEELVIPETIQKIEQNHFSLAKSLKKLVILIDNLNYNEHVLQNINEQIEIYVANEELKTKLIDWGIKEHQIHLLTSTPHFFMTKQKELVALTKNGQKASTLVIIPEIKVINEQAFLGSRASLIDFTKINLDDPLKISGQPFRHFSGQYKVRDENTRKRLIDAGADQEKINWMTCSAKSVGKSWLIASTASLAIIGVGLGVGIPLYFRYRKTRVGRE